jgi:GDP-L-fucose synthase
MNYSNYPHYFKPETHTYKENFKKMSINLKDKVVWVTGASSMIGRSVVKQLIDKKANVVSATHKHCDLMDLYNIKEVFGEFDIDYAILLQTYSGNIQFNISFPADVFYRTSQMAINTLKFCQEKGIKKVVSILSSCAYPNTGQILKESELWMGQPDESIESHGFSKRILAEYSRQLSRQYGLCAVSAIVNNSYGEYDNFDLRKTKVVGSLIKKFTDAKNSGVDNVTLWGSGVPVRSFIYSQDVGVGLVKVLERYDSTEIPINIASDEQISIKDLSDLIAKLVEYEGNISWTFGKDGQMLKILSTDRMKHSLQWQPETSLENGLRKTIDWYNKNIVKKFGECIS